ncbi:MAG: methionyl-tRNA formyltransferase [Clostridiales bacterium]|jgi:methionyl-tRNA formyltransferase|nr:methionyl-tRNA formyltransferase [Clostridiales bacterium]
MGTPDFAVPCLKALIDSDDNVVGVFTQPDKPKGRGYKLQPTPVKAVAQEHGIDVYQPVSLKKGDDAQEAFKILKELNPDLIIVVAYGQILPKHILDLPKYGCINIHASILPKYRGAAPIQWCVMNGDKKTGVTSMLMEEGLDTGDMLITAETDIDINETVSELHDRLSEMGSDVLIKTIEALKEGKLNPQKQDDSKSCYAPMITKDMCRIDFSDTAINIHNKIRAITGYTILNGKRLKLYRTQICDRVVSGCECGSIVDEKSLTVVCGDGKCITLLEVQPEGSKRMKTEDFLRGNKLTAGIKFE